MAKTTLCSCWHCGKQVRVSNDLPLPAQSDIFCRPCARACGVTPTRPPPRRHARRACTAPPPAPLSSKTLDQLRAELVDAEKVAEAALDQWRWSCHMNSARLNPLPMVAAKTRVRELKEEIDRRLLTNPTPGV